MTEFFLSIIIGPMFSGKSSYLIKNIKKSIENNENILVVNHSIDKRYNENKITNHNQVSVDCISISNLNDIFSYCSNKNIDLNTINHFYVDEAQFFPDLENVVKLMLKNYPNLKITCVGLDGDYKQEVFNDGQLLKLIPYADNVEKLYSKCAYCGGKASFTKRKTNSKEQVIVASEDIYEPVCYIHK